MTTDATSRRRIVSVLLAIAVAAIAAFVAGAWWMRTSATAPPLPSVADAGDVAASPAPSDTTGTAASPNPDSAVASAPAAAAAWPALPPLDAPLADVLDDLTDRARRGDPKAACRLGAVLQRCLMARASGNTAADVERDVARRENTPEAAVNTIARLQSQAERAGKGCEGVPVDQLHAAFAWQKQAALANPDLRVAFALSPALDPRDFVNELDAWRDYRALALPWLEQAAAEGDLAAVIALARVHGDLRRTGPRVPPFRLQDDERFVVYADLMQRYGSHVDIIDSEARAARERLSPEARDRAQARADALYRADAARDPSAADEAMRASLRVFPDPARCE